MQPFLDYGIVVEWIEKEFNGVDIRESDVVVSGAPWSPAKVRNTDLGWQLLLSTTSVTVDNLSENRFWAKQ